MDENGPAKWAAAEAIYQRGALGRDLDVPHQVVIEFMAAVTRPRGPARGLLSSVEAVHEVEEIMLTLPLLFPTPSIIRAALRIWATYGINWYDAHLLAYAEAFGIEEVLSEDFAHHQRYGSIRVINPFA